MKLDFTWEAIELRRDRIQRLSPELAVRTKKQALRFVNRVGFCFLFRSEDSELPSLWNAICGMRNAALPRRSQRGPYLSFVTDLRRILPDGKIVYYGRILQGRPTVVSLDLLPYFFALSRRVGKKDEYLSEFLHGRLSPQARDIMEVLLDSSPQDTRGLKLALGSSSRHKSMPLEKGINELQSKMFIVNVATEYDPFTFQWEPVNKSFSQQLKQSRKITVDEARAAILGKYFENQAVSTVVAIHHLFGWKKQLIFSTVGTLVDRGIIVPNARVDGKDGTFYASVWPNGR